MGDFYIGFCCDDTPAGNFKASYAVGLYALGHDIFVLIQNASQRHLMRELCAGWAFMHGFQALKERAGPPIHKWHLLATYVDVAIRQSQYRKCRSTVN